MRGMAMRNVFIVVTLMLGISVASGEIKCIRAVQDSKAEEQFVENVLDRCESMFLRQAKQGADIMRQLKASQYAGIEPAFCP